MWPTPSSNVEKEPFPKRQVLDSSILKEFADDNLKFDENGGKFSKKVETLCEKDRLLVTSNFSFSHSVFKKLVQQIRRNKDMDGKRLKQGV